MMFKHPVALACVGKEQNWKTKLVFAPAPVVASTLPAPLLASESSVTCPLGSGFRPATCSMLPWNESVIADGGVGFVAGVEAMAIGLLEAPQPASMNGTAKNDKNE